jgi:hypothetical protein
MKKDQIFNTALILLVVLFGIIISNGTPSSDIIIIDRMMLSTGLKPWSGDFRGFHYAALVQIAVFIFTYYIIKSRGKLVSEKMDKHPLGSMFVLCFVVSRLYFSVQNMFI